MTSLLNYVNLPCLHGRGDTWDPSFTFAAKAASITYTRHLFVRVCLSGVHTLDGLYVYMQEGKRLSLLEEVRGKAFMCFLHMSLCVSFDVSVYEYD